MNNITLAKETLSHIDKIIHDFGEGPHDGLLGGELGMVLYYYEKFKVTNEAHYGTSASELLDTIFERINSDTPHLMGSTLSNGLAGLGYVVNYLQKEGFLDLDLSEELADLDEHLYEQALIQISEHKNDYLHGAFGIMFYFSERLPDEKIEIYLTDLVTKVLANGVTNMYGTHFRNYSLKENDEATNLSLSHGLSGMLMIFGRIYQKGVLREQLQETIQKGMFYMVQFKQEIDNMEKIYSMFPHWTILDADGYPEPHYGNRLAWCYGDFNQTMLYYEIADCFDDAALRKIADLIGLNTLLRKSEEATAVTDPYFCHGAAGVAQIYKLFYDKTKYEPYKKGYEYWIGQTLEMLEKELAEEQYKGKERGLLEGLVGISLVLTEYVSEQKLTWNKVLLFQ
jgi:lantibiotic biosynthesis protein